MLLTIVLISLLFVVIGYVVTDKNAKYLLSGYNTMSESERQNFDLKSYIRYFRNFHLFIGITILSITMLLYYFLNPDWSVIFMGTFPILAYSYFVWKSNQFYTSQTKKKIHYFVVFGLIFLFLFISYNLKEAIADNTIVIENKQLVISGQYGTAINLSQIKSIQLITNTPTISNRINGFSLQTIKKGYYRTKEGEKVKLLINSSQKPLLLLTTKENDKIYYSSKETSNKKVYSLLNSKLKIKKNTFNRKFETAIE